MINGEGVGRTGRITQKGQQLIGRKKEEKVVRAANGLGRQDPSGEEKTRRLTKKEIGGDVLHMID